MKRWGSWLLPLSTLALVPAPSAPPVSPDLPERVETAKALNRIVPPAQPEAVTVSEARVATVEGKVVAVSPENNVLDFASSKGARRLKVAPDVAITVDGRPVDSLADVPEGREVRATLADSDVSQTLQIETYDWAGQQQDTPAHGYGHIIEP